MYSPASQWTGSFRTNHSNRKPSENSPKKSQGWRKLVFSVWALLIILSLIHGTSFDKDDLPGRKAIAAHCDFLAKARIEEIKPAVIKASQENRLAISVDFGRRFHDYLAM